MADPIFRAVSSIGTIAGSGGGGAGSVNKPTGTVDGDYIFIVILNKANAFAGNAAPSGFTLLLSKTNTTYQAGFRIYGKVASSEPSSYSVTETSTANPSQIFAVSYSNPGGTPINASVVGSLQNSTTTPGVPTLTTTATGKLIGMLAEYQGRSITLTAAGAMTSRLADANTNVSFIWADEDIATTGSISGRTASGSASGDYTSAAILLTAAASAPVLSSATQTATGPTQVTIGVTSDTAPTTTAISYQILPAATGAPSAATIVGAPDGTIATGSAGALTKAITGLTTNTAVKAHFAQGSTSNVVSTASFTPNTAASSGSPSAQSGTAGGSLTWAGATPDSFVTNHGNGAGAWSIVSSAGFTVAPSINTGTGVLSGGTLSSAGTYAPQIRYTDSSTVPSAQQINFTLSLTVTGGGGGGDTTPPTLTGSITIGTVTSSSIQMSWPAGSDNVAVTSYEVSKDGGTSWVNAGNVLTYTFTVLTASTSYPLRVRAKDAAGNVSTPALSASQSTSAGSGSYAGFDFDTAAGCVFGNVSGSLVGLGRESAGRQINVYVKTVGTDTTVAYATALTLDSNARLPRWTHAALVAGTDYDLFFCPVDGGKPGVRRMRAT